MGLKETQPDLATRAVIGPGTDRSGIVELQTPVSELPLRQALRRDLLERGILGVTPDPKVSNRLSVSDRGYQQEETDEKQDAYRLYAIRDPPWKRLPQRSRRHALKPWRSPLLWVVEFELKNKNNAIMILMN